MSAKGWAFPKNARVACYFVFESSVIPASSLCGRKALQPTIAVNEKYAGNDRCPACRKQLDKLQREEIG